MKVTKLLPVLAAAVLIAAPASAHHSVAASFDTSSVIEIEGEVIAVKWRNPHASFQLEVTDAAGAVEKWNVEMTSLTNLRRSGVEGQLVDVGDTIRVAGNPGRRDARTIYAENLLIADGEEVLLETRAEPRWANEVRGREGPSGPGDSSAPELGIFRVWSSPGDQPLLLPEDVEPVFDYERYPLTVSARAVVGAFDRIADSPILNCVAKGMPTIMEQPYPLEFVRSGEDIRLRLEEYDTVRVIHMAADASDDGQPASKLGFSVGRWDGDNTLIVRTTRSNWAHFDVVGIPLGEDAEMLERFTVGEDGSRLDYSLTVTDPTTFTEPVTVTKFWVWYPQMTVEPYNCAR